MRTLVQEDRNIGLQTDYEINAMQDGQCMDIKIGGVALDMLIDSGAM